MNLLPYVTFCSSLALATWVKPAGWLDRLVQYHKEKFLGEVKELTPPIQIKATVVAKEPGYVDSKDWDFESVIRLLTLIRDSEHAKPVKMVLRRMLKPTRRWLTDISKKESFKLFPSLSKGHPNEMYYDIDSAEMYAEDNRYNKYLSLSSKVAEDDSVIIISNPVESRLPSRQISVALLKDILEKRAEAARQMPTRKTTMFTTKKSAKKADNATSPDVGGGDITGSVDPAVGNDTTAAAP